MPSSTTPESAEVPDWDVMYRLGTPPWETGRPAAELVRVVNEKLVRPCRTLEIGCGTGADAVYLAKQRFEVTAVDASATAIDRARNRAEREDALLRWVLDDVYDFAPTAGEFDLVYDSGFYHSIRRTDLGRFLDMLWRVTRPGSYYLALIGRDGETAEGGPPQVSEKEVRYELSRPLDFVHLRHCRMESPQREEGFAGWSCLMQRPQATGGGN